MKHTGSYYETLQFFDGTMARNKSKEIDYYRARWYEWTDSMIDKIK
jgi:hypothetical protein